MAETELAQRMALATVGQVTWPELGTKRRCNCCAHFDRSGVTRPRVIKGFGVCALVERHVGRSGVQFIGTRAQACRYWEAAPRKKGGG